MFTNVYTITIKIIITIVVVLLLANVISVGFEKYQCSRMLEAIENDDMEKLQSAVKYGDVNSVTGITCLEMFLIEFPARKTPLQAACAEGNFEMVKFLVENGADIHYRPSNARIHALCYAVQSKEPENLRIVKFLIETDANANISRPGLIEGAASRATDYLFYVYPFPSNGMEILRELVNAGGRPGAECVRFACYWGNDEAIRFLVKECKSDISGYLHIWLYCKDFEKYSQETFEFMLQHGADPYAKNEDGKCAMDCLEEVSPEWAEILTELAAEYGYTK